MRAEVEAKGQPERLSRKEQYPPLAGAQLQQQLLLQLLRECKNMSFISS